MYKRKMKFTWYTSYIRVSGVPLRAEADRFMVGHKALGVGSAAARIHTVPEDNKHFK